jgi:predicted alpha/beta-hydrolase family hydrolase
VSDAATATIAVPTPSGEARVHLHPAAGEPRAALVLGHGAGGGFAARDLVAATALARDAGFTVAQVEQPYRVAGRRSPPPAPRLDAAWLAVVERLRSAEIEGLPLVAGGRSSGARVACRTAGQTGAIAVLCLAFPLQPPARAGAPRPSRLPELEAVAVPVLIVQGANDAFGMPPATAARIVVEVPGGHSLHGGLGPATDEVRAWLERVTARPRTGATSPARP